MTLKKLPHMLYELRKEDLRVKECQHSCKDTVNDSKQLSNIGNSQYFSLSTHRGVHSSCLLLIKHTLFKVVTSTYVSCRVGHVHRLSPLRLTPLINEFALLISELINLDLAPPLLMSCYSSPSSCGVHDWRSRSSKCLQLLTTSKAIN